MKSFACIVLCIYSMLTYAQNVKDSYGDHTGDEEWPNVGVYGPYTGEYQIFLDQFFWTHANELDDGCISFSIEIVSFPFIPDEFRPTQNNQLQDEDRDLNIKVVNGIYKHLSTPAGSGSNGADHYEGLGWEYGDYYIFSKLYNINECGVGV